MVKSEATTPVKARRRYTEEFKSEAVRLVRVSAHPVAQVARDLGIPDNVCIAGAPSTARPRFAARHAWLNAPTPRHSRV